VRVEWVKSMRAAAPSVAFDVMREVGVLAITCPELMESVGCTQNKWHAFDVWGHAMATLDACKDDPILRVAALFHDVGKPRTREFSVDKNDFTFYEHERVGAEMAEPILARLRFSNAERAKVVALVRHHLITYDASWGDAAVRRWLRRVTPELAPDLYEIGFADARGKGRPCEEDIARVEALCARAEAMIAAGAALTARALAVDGKVLMSELGLPPGRVIGKLLERLVDAVTEDPSLNERDKLLAEARRVLPELAAPALDAAVTSGGVESKRD
jgi:tRNA nucleotidyltransferase (CCA-adding enzyme)